MDKMMNRYITALLVVLTATGLEAQAYQSALKAARGGDVALEELCRHSVFQGKEAEILSFIRAIKSVEQRDDQEPAHAPWVAQVDSEGLAGRVACAPWGGATSPPQRVIHNKKESENKATK